MSERIFGTEKVDKIIGLKDQNVYDKIDVFVDITNNNNLWGMVYYTEYKNHKPIQRQEIVRFQDHKSMMEYVKSNFDGYELDHPVDVNYKHIFFHYVDYCDINYYYFDGKPDKNYIVIKAYEYANNMHNVVNIRLPKEYENTIVSVFKVSKNMLGNLGPRYHHDIDVYEERANNRKEILKSITMTIEEFFSLMGDEIKKVVGNKKIVRGITIFVSTTVLASLLASGYKIIKDNEYNSDYMNQKGTVNNAKDVSIYIDKGKAGIIIEKLLNNDYRDITPDDMMFIVDYISEVNESNFDNNNSFNSFNYSKYFDMKLDYHIDYSVSSHILKRIEELYNSCFKTIDGKVTIVTRNIDRYITYVSSLTFMYDTYSPSNNQGITYVKLDTQNISSPYATSKEIEVFNQFPAVLKYTIMNQLRGVLQRSNYEIKTPPSYYFGGTDKYGMLTELDKKTNLIVDSMYFQCGINYQRM